MPFCPKCRYEYVEGIAVCPDCDVSLERVLPPEIKATEDRPVPVMAAENMIEADIIKEILESAGIPCLIQTDTSRLYSHTFIKDRAIVILVPESKLSDAQEAIRQASEGGREIAQDVWGNIGSEQVEEGQEGQKPDE